jgi:nucleotide-binding universal stress UspA family protein
MIKKILAPTDFSTLSAKGVLYACQLAKEVGAELVLINIVTLDESNLVNKREMEQHKKLLDEFLEKVGAGGSGLTIRKVVEPGQPHSTLVHWAENEAMDLIVISSHGRSGLSRMVMGSVTAEILKKSACPVLVVPAERQK